MYVKNVQSGTVSTGFPSTSAALLLTVIFIEIGISFLIAFKRNVMKVDTFMNPFYHTDIININI